MAKCNQLTSLPFKGLITNFLTTAYRVGANRCKPAFEAPRLCSAEINIVIIVSCYVQIPLKLNRVSNGEHKPSALL